MNQSQKTRVIADLRKCSNRIREVSDFDWSDNPQVADKIYLTCELVEELIKTAKAIEVIDGRKRVAPVPKEMPRLDICPTDRCKAD